MRCTDITFANWLKFHKQCYWVDDRYRLVISVKTQRYTRSRRLCVCVCVCVYVCACTQTHTHTQIEINMRLSASACRCALTFDKRLDSYQGKQREEEIEKDMYTRKSQTHTHTHRVCYTACQENKGTK